MRILSDVEPAQLVKVVFENADYAEIYADPADMCPGRSGRFQQVSVGGSTFLDAASYVAEYEGALSRDPEAAMYRRYFLELDKSSHSKLLDLRIGSWTFDEVRQSKVAVDEVMRELKERVLRRRDIHAGGGQPPATLGSIPDIRSGYLGKISAMKLQLVREHLGIEDPEHDDLTPVWEAFVRFASGDLRVRLASHAYSCQPSTGFFFLFGELALLCADSGVDPEAWKRLAPILIATREIFVDVYAPASAGRHDFDDFNACNFDQAKRVNWTQGRFDDLKATYSAMGYPELSAQSCHQIGTHLSGATS